MLLYYLLIQPLSRLPLAMLYPIGGFFAWILHYLVRYRRSVILSNLKLALPDRTESEHLKILKNNYKYLGRLLAEGIKNLGIKRNDLLERVVVRNPEVMDKLYKQGRSVVLLASHFENWEFIITAQQDLFPHQAMGIGKPLSQGFLNKKINELRSRYGMKVVHAGNYKEEMKAEMENGPLAILTLADQSPVPETAYWTRFFNVLTPFPYGPEYMAHNYNMAVVFCDVFQDGKGHYILNLEPLVTKPSGLRYGDIMEAYVEKHEAQILRKPEAWLWTHKRWKHQAPKDLGDMRTNQEQQFSTRFA